MKEIELLVERLLEITKREITQTGRVLPRVYIMGAPDDDRDDLIMMRDPSMMDSARAKTALFAEIRERVKERRATLVAFISEAWMALQSEEQRRMADIIERALEMPLDVERLVDIGLATGKQEIIMLRVDTPLRTLQISVPFQRTEDGIAFGEEKRFDSLEGAKPSGKLWFFEDLGKEHRA